MELVHRNVVHHLGENHLAAVHAPLSLVAAGALSRPAGPENFQIEKVDMERLTNKICDVLAERESEGMFQSELWKKLKLSSRDGSRLALKLERMGTIYREKILDKGRWTYKLILKKTPISTLSIENAPCLVCPVEQKCSLEGEISPRNCQFIEDWVLADMKKPAKVK